MPEIVKRFVRREFRGAIVKKDTLWIGLDWIGLDWIGLDWIGFSPCLYLQQGDQVHVRGDIHQVLVGVEVLVLVVGLAVAASCLDTGWRAGFLSGY